MDAAGPCGVRVSRQAASGKAGRQIGRWASMQAGRCTPEGHRLAIFSIAIAVAKVGGADTLSGHALHVLPA